MTFEYIILYIEKFIRGVGFLLRFLSGILSYDDFYEFQRTSAILCRVQTPACRILRLTNYPCDVTTVYGLAKKDRALRASIISGNILGCFTYPMEVLLLMAELHIITDREWIGTVNILGWIMWLCIEIFRWSRQGYLANIKLAYNHDEPVFYIMRTLAVTSILGSCLDMVIAVNWLPEWSYLSDTLPMSGVGVLGVISTLFCVHRVYLRHLQESLD